MKFPAHQGTDVEHYSNPGMLQHRISTSTTLFLCEWGFMTVFHESVPWRIFIVPGDDHGTPVQRTTRVARDADSARMPWIRPIP
jgi:hypothetical protein